MPKFKYETLAQRLKSEITAGNYAPGDKIPPEDELVQKYQMSRNTIRQAVSILETEGLLVKLQGSGTFISEKLKELQQKKHAQNSRFIGVVMNQVDDYIFPHVLMGINDCLSQNGYHLLIRMTFNSVNKERHILNELLTQNLAGLIVEPARSAWPLVNTQQYEAIAAKIPCVTIHGELPHPAFPSIDNNDVASAEILVDHLVQKGHQNIAAFFKSDEQPGLKRYKGFAQALFKHDLPFNESQLLWYTEEDLADLLAEHNAPRILRVVKNCTAIMCFNDRLAANLIPFLERHDLHVPKDISLVGFDDLWLSHTDKPVTSVEHPKNAFGKKAAQAVLDLIKNPFANVSHRFPTKVVEHHSVAIKKAK